jgi:hypothetical protein
VCNLCYLKNSRSYTEETSSAQSYKVEERSKCCHATPRQGLDPAASLLDCGQGYGRFGRLDLNNDARSSYTVLPYKLRHLATLLAWAEMMQMWNRRPPMCTSGFCCCYRVAEARRHRSFNVQGRKHLAIQTASSRRFSNARMRQRVDGCVKSGRVAAGLTFTHRPRLRSGLLRF